MPRTWEFNLDEGSGTAANNTGLTTQGNYLNQPLWDRATLDGDGTRYIEIPQVAFGSSDDFSVRLDWIRTTGLTQDLLGDGTSGIRVQDGTDNIFVIGESGTATLSAAAAGIANGEHVSLEFRRVSGSTEGFVNGASVAVSGTAIGEFLVSLLYQYTGINILAAGSAIGNVILENLTTGEYVEYRIDEGSSTTVKAYDRAGNVIPASNGTITPDAAWTQQPEYSNNGQWTPDTDWQYVFDNTRYYPMNDGGATLRCIDGTGTLQPTLDGTIVNHNINNWS